MLVGDVEVMCVEARRAKKEEGTGVGVERKAQDELTMVSLVITAELSWCCRRLAKNRIEKERRLRRGSRGRGK